MIAPFEAFETDRLLRESAAHDRRRRMHPGTQDPPARDAAGFQSIVTVALEHNRARAFSSDERTRDVEAVFGKELFQVVARHAARNLRKAAADRAPRNCRESIAARNTPRRGGRRRARSRRALESDVGPTVSSVPSYNRIRSEIDVVDGLARNQRMRAAGVVADHAAERAAAVRRRVRPEGEADAPPPCVRRVSSTTPGCTRAVRLADVEVENPVHVFGEVQHDRDIAALTREARAGAAREDRRLRSFCTRLPRHDTSWSSFGTTTPIGTWR